MNPSNGRIESDPQESRGGPPLAASDGTDASRLAAAKEAAKKKLLRMVVQQATEELGDADAIVEQAFSEGLVSETLIEGLRQSVRARMTARLVRQVAETDGQVLAAEAAAAMAEAPEIRSAVESVERRLAGAIAAKALEGMEDEAVVAERIAEEIARANEAAVGALADDVRGMVMQTITDRAWASAVDPEELVRLAEGRVNPDDPTIAEATGILAERAAEAAAATALDAVKQRIADSIATTVQSDEFVESTVSRVEIDPEVVGRATERIRATAVAEVTDRVRSSLDAESMAADLVSAAVAQIESGVMEQVVAQVRESGMEARVAEAVHAATIEAVRSRVLESLEASAVATDMVPETVSVIESTVLALVTDAIRESSIIERVTEQVKETVCDRITDAVFDAETLMQRVEARLSDEPSRLQHAAERARAEFAVQLTEDLIAAVTADEAIDSLTDQAVAEVRVQVAQDVSRRVLATSADELAAGAVAHFDADSEQVLASVGLARLELLRHIASRAESSLEDADGAARQALASFDFNAKVVSAAADALRTEVIASVAHQVAADIATEGVHASDDRVIGVIDAGRAGLSAALYDRILAAVTDAEATDMLRRSVVSDPAVADLVEAARADAWKTLSSRVASRLLSASSEELAGAAAEQVEAEASLIEASSEALRLRVLERVADRAVASLSDADQAAEASAAFVPADAKVITDAAAALRGRLTAQVAERVLAELEAEGIPTDDPRMEAATQSVRTLVSGFLYAQAMKVASSAKERDRVAREVAREVHELLLTDTLEALAGRTAEELAAEAHGRIESLDPLIAEAKNRLADRITAELAASARQAVSADGIDLSHPAVRESVAHIEREALESIRERALESVRGSDARGQVASQVAAAVHEIVTSDALKAILARNPIEMAQAVAAQISGDEPVIGQAVESVLASLQADIARSAERRLVDEVGTHDAARAIVEAGSGPVTEFIQAVADSLRSIAADRAVESVTSQAVVEELALAGSHLLHERLVLRIAEKTAAETPDSLASEADRIVAASPAASEAAELLHARLVERIATDALGQLGSVAAASEKARIVAESERETLEDAVNTLHDFLAARVGEEVTRRIRSTDGLAEAAASFVDPDDPAVGKAADEVARDLGRLVALRAVERVTDSSTREELVAEADAACAAELSTAVEDGEKRLMDRLVGRIAQRFTDAGDTARRALERLGSDHAPLIAAQEVLKELVLEDLSRKATLLLLDAAQAADRAFSRIDLDDPRFARAQEALRQRIVEAVAERSLTALEDHEAAAGMVRARIHDDHENVVGTAALVRDMLLDDIARRSEASLADTRTVARLSRQRVPEESLNLASAQNALRDMLLDDVVRLTTKAFEDAESVAEQAAGRVDPEGDVLLRARSAFKERILMNVLGEAIREISGAFGSGRVDAQQAVFQQAMHAMARQASPGPDRSPAPPTRAAAEEPVPFVSAPEAGGTPSGAEHPDAAPSPASGNRTAPSAPAPQDAWVRLSDFDAAVSEARPEGPVETGAASWIDEGPGIPEPPVIVTEFVEHEFDAEETEDDDTFDFGWAGSAADGDGSTRSVEVGTVPIDFLPGDAMGDGLYFEDEAELGTAADDGALPTYVYGFTQADGTGMPAAVEGQSMDPDFGLRFVTVRSVRAIVSAVPAEDFSPEALRERSKDTAWLRERIRTHARVLDAFKTTTTVVPLRFGAVFENEADVAAMLEGRHDELSASVDRLRGKMEWGVRAVRNLDRLRSRILEGERAVDESLGSLSSGVAQFVRDELSRAADLGSDALADTITRHCLSRADEHLRRWAADAVEKAIVPGKADVILNRAYLVDQATVSAFRDEIARLSAEFGSLGITFELTGPWPAFHFSGIDDSDLAGTVPAQG